MNWTHYYYYRYHYYYYKFRTKNTKLKVNSENVAPASLKKHFSDREEKEEYITVTPPSKHRHLTTTIIEIMLLYLIYNQLSV